MKTHPPRYALNYTRYAAACVCVLYSAKKLTKTIHEFKDNKPETGVELLNDASMAVDLRVKVEAA